MTQRPLAERLREAYRSSPAVHWTWIGLRWEKPCATAGCQATAAWHMEAGGIGSDYCQQCSGKIISELKRTDDA